MFITGDRRPSHLPVPLFALVQLCGVRCQPTYVELGRWFPPVFLHSSQRISPCTSAPSMLLFFFLISQALTKSAVFLEVSGGACTRWPPGLGRVRCHTSHACSSHWLPHFLSLTRQRGCCLQQLSPRVGRGHPLLRTGQKSSSSDSRLACSRPWRISHGPAVSSSSVGCRLPGANFPGQYPQNF